MMPSAAHRIAFAFLALLALSPPSAALSHVGSATAGGGRAWIRSVVTSGRERRRVPVLAERGRRPRRRRGGDAAANAAVDAIEETAVTAPSSGLPDHVMWRAFPGDLPASAARPAVAGPTTARQQNATGAEEAPYRFFYGDDGLNTMMRGIGAKPLLTPEEVNVLARKTQQYERMRRAQAELEEELGREASDSEVAERLEIGGGAREYRRLLRVYLGAKNLLVQSNMRLVYSVAKRFVGQGLSIQDLVQEGSLGMLRATELYDPDRGNKLSTYATWWIRQSMRRAIANSARDIRIPIHAQDELRRMRAVRGKLFERLGRTPSLGELAEEMGMPHEKIELLERAGAMSPMVSIEGGFSASGGWSQNGYRRRTLQDALNGERVSGGESSTPDSAIERADLRAQIHRLLDTELLEIESLVLRLRFGLRVPSDADWDADADFFADDATGADPTHGGTSLGRGEPLSIDEVARHVGLTRDQVRRLEMKALNKLRSLAASDDDDTHPLRAYVATDATTMR